MFEGFDDNVLMRSTCNSGKASRCRLCHYRRLPNRHHQLDLGSTRPMSCRKGSQPVIGDGDRVQGPKVLFYGRRRKERQTQCRVWWDATNIWRQLENSSFKISTVEKCLLRVISRADSTEK